jgi:ribosome modulation factor
MKRSSQPQEARHAGYTAQTEGKGIDGNPFNQEREPRQWYQWHSGWQAAEEDARETQS